MCPVRTLIQWCRRGESNRRATLKSRKLLILRIARNAKNVFHGYAAVTRSAARIFMAVGIAGTQNFILGTKVNKQALRGPFCDYNPAGHEFHPDKIYEIHFLSVFLGSLRFLCTKRHIAANHWPRRCQGLYNSAGYLTPKKILTGFTSDSCN
jgi:hypothetical protein